MRRAVLPLLAMALLAPAAHAKHRRANQLLRVITPVDRGSVPAHPFVNVVVRFSSTGSVAADPSTFRAEIGHRNVTDLFQPDTDPTGAVIGRHARLDRSLLHLGRRANQLRLSVEGRLAGRSPSLRDVDRIRFRAFEAPDQPPVARLLAGSDVVLPGIAVTFDGSHSHDPDDDTLTYAWDFGDGTTSSAPSPTHVYARGTATVVARLTVSDGLLSATDQATLFATPPLDPGRTPGRLRIDAAGALDFGAVAPGFSATQTLVVSNPDATATSQLKVELATSTPAFRVSPATLDLAAGRQQSVTVTFAPSGPGHQSGTVTAVASASNAPVIELLAHGFGGSAPGTGPTLAASTLFYQTALGAPRGILPDGTRFTVDNTVGQCQGTGDPCIVAADCASGTCLPSTQTFDPVDMCTDGQNLYLLSDDVFTDNTSASRTVGVLALALAPSGARTGADILYRTTSCTMRIACDHVPGGSLYLSEYHDVNLPARCFRSAQENLVQVNRATGAATTLLDQVDSVEGLDSCNDDLDPANDLEVATTRTGPVVYADFSGGFSTGGGVYRAWPAPLAISPDITDFFQVHPDGSVLYVTTQDTAASGLLSIYKVSPQQALSGAPALADLTPCATVEVPNNGGRTFLDSDAGSFALAPQPAGAAGTLLVSFFTTGGTQLQALGTPPVLAAPLAVQGTVAVDVPAGTGACTVLGFVTLEFLDSMRF